MTLSKVKWRPSRLALIAYATGVLSASVVIAIVFGITSVKSDPPRLFQDFSKSPNGAVTRADSGQEWSHSNNGAPGAGLQVIDGKLSNIVTSSTPGAGYISFDMGEPVTEVGGTFEFSAGSSMNGSATFVIRQVMLPPTPNGPSIITSPCHLVITPWKMDYGVAKDGTITVLESQKFAQPLDFDKPYGVRARLDYQKGTVVVDAPDGNSYTYSDARISANKADIISFEVFQQDASTDDRASFHAVNASAE